MIESPIGVHRFHRRVGVGASPRAGVARTLDKIRHTISEYNFAGQYQQMPAPAGGGLVKKEWFKYYTETELPKKFDQVLQSWDTANKVTELSDYSVCTTWGIKVPRVYLLHVLRKRLNYPELKRAVREQFLAHSATVLLIEDRASGTQLIQELSREGLTVRACKPENAKVMRLHAQTATIENGFVFLPREAAWLAEYVHELTTFPNAKYDDQTDSTSQALEWFNRVGAEPGLLGYYRQMLARQMFDEGYPLEAIAGRCETTTDEVRSWVNVREFAPSSGNLAQSYLEIYEETHARLNGERNCARCGKELPPGATYVLAGDRRYCSNKCATGIP